MRPSVRIQLVAPLAALACLTACADRPAAPGPASREVVPVAAPTPSRAAPEVRDLAFLEQYASTFRFRAGTPTSITPTPDGKAVLFLRSGPRSRVQDLYEFDVATGQERVVLTAELILGGGEERLTAEELARRERMRQISRGISSFQLSDDGQKLLVPLSGRLFVVDRLRHTTTERTPKAGFPIDPRFNPDATRIACVCDGDLVVIDVGTGEERKLTSHDKDSITNGLAEFAAQEEMDRFAGFWWSPDGTHIAYEQADTSALETFTIADPVNPDRPARTWPYPRPGKANAGVKLGVVPVSGGDTRWIEWDHAKYEYLANVRWDKGGPLTLVLLDRTQNDLRVLGVDTASGFSVPLLDEHDDAWINLSQAAPRWLDDASGFLWVNESSGFPTLQLRDATGRLVRTLAGKESGLLALTHFDPASGIAHLAASDDPAQTHVARLDVRQPEGGPVRITRGNGSNSLAAGKGLAAYVVASSDLAGARSWTVHRADGARAGALRSDAEKPTIAPAVDLVTVGEKNYRAAVLRPRDFDPKKRYPVILSVYAGPHTTVVAASSWPHLLNQWFADQGFIVAMLDGRGTPRRGREWERAIKGDLISIPLADQVEGLRALGARFPEMDLTRVGVYGWSFGGYFSAMAAMQRPDVFKAACAGAPVCDWRDYDTCYTERYLGLPQQHPEAYDKSSVLTYCKDLKVPLLIVHGTADDNVYFMHSLKMADALFKNGKDYEFLVLPGFTHMVPDPVVTRSLYSRIAAFFLENLGRPR